MVITFINSKVETHRDRQLTQNLKTEFNNETIVINI